MDPLALLSNMQIPEWGIDWLKHEQVALMAALFAHRTGLFTLGQWVEIGRSFTSFPGCRFPRRLLGTVMIGLFSLMKLRNFF